MENNAGSPWGQGGRAKLRSIDILLNTSCQALYFASGVYLVSFRVQGQMLGFLWLNSLTKPLSVILDISFHLHFTNPITCQYYLMLKRDFQAFRPHFSGSIAPIIVVRCSRHWITLSHFTALMENRGLVNIFLLIIYPISWPYWGAYSILALWAISGTRYLK